MACIAPGYLAKLACAPAAPPGWFEP